MKKLFTWLKSFRQTHFFVTPKESRAAIEVAQMIGRQVSREETEADRQLYKKATIELINLRLHWRASIKVVKVELELDEKLFKNDAGFFCQNTISQAVTEKIQAQWNKRVK